MSISFKSFVAVLVLLAPVSEAVAKSVSISGKHTRGEIANKCFKHGGQFYGLSKKDGGGFGCINESKGTAVHCTSDGKCTGEVPA